MITSRILRALSLLGFVILAASSNATAILGCKTVTKTNVACSTISGATDERGGIYAPISQNVGYRGDLNQPSVTTGGALTVTNYDVFATSVADLATADQDSGATRVDAIGTDTLLSGFVLGGLGDNAVGVKVSEQPAESQTEHASVNFGDIVAGVSTTFISSGGGLPGMTARSDRAAYFVSPVPEPALVLLLLTGLGFMGLSRSKG